MPIKEIQNFDPCDLIQFLNQEARKDYQYNDKKDFFNAGVAFMLACVRKYFNDSFDIPIRDNNGWISVDDSTSYADAIFCSSGWQDYKPHRFYQIITKNGVLYTATCNAICYDGGSGQKVFSVCTVKNFYGMYELHEMSELCFGIDEVKYWQPLSSPPKE